MQENKKPPPAEAYAGYRHRRRIWKKVMLCLGCLVVFVTTYLLILPAITLEQTAYCGMEEHTHDENCYEKRLVCGYHEGEADAESEKSHIHTEGCYQQEQVLICGLEESSGHVHNESCVQKEQMLICGDTAEEHEHNADCYVTTETYICGLTQGEGAHIHGAQCYENRQVLVCSLSETEGNENLAQTSHVHTKDCYEEVMICTKAEHQHEMSCYSDPGADVESAAVWERSIAGVSLTGVKAEDVLAIARSQLGYRESTRNYIVAEDGRIKGYTRYGAWYGDSYGDWCAMFVSFCLHYAQVDEMPLDANCQHWINQLKTKGMYAEAADYIPKPGDLIFFDYDSDGDAEHIGIVEEISGTALKTIEGNSGDIVARNEYNRTDRTILGYGIFPVEEIPVITKTAVVYTDRSCNTQSEENTVITLTGCIPENAEVRAFPVSIETEQQQLCAYDIEIVLPDGSLFEPDKGQKISVSIQSPEMKELDEKQRMAVYYLPEDGDPEPINSSETEEGICFDADHFSVYAVMAVDLMTVNTKEELKAAIEAGQENIRLGADFEAEPMALPASANITLDLNGHTLRQKGTASPFSIPEGTSLTIADGKAEEETVASGGRSLAGNTAAASEDGGKVTLTYYLTTSGVTDSATGATQETVEEHTVTSAGAIIAGNQTVFQVNGTLNLQSGMIYGGTGRAIVQTGGIVNLSGGYICGFSQSSGNTDNTSFGGAIRTGGGVLNLSGSVIAGNTAQNGGAVYATGSSQINITGGAVSGNTANRTTSGWSGHSESGAYRCGGGGIYADGNVEILMDGGYITNNVAIDTGYFDGGGGICLSGESGMTLASGFVTGNQAQGGGGIRSDFGKETTFLMSGGFVSANVATSSEGGGIAIDRGGEGSVVGGYITNNRIPNTGHWGGGGLFCADGSTLRLRNSLITNNTAGGFGAGVAGCPTGNLYLYVDEGCAIFDNRDTVDGDSPHFTSDGVKQIDREICTAVFQSNGHADYFCALNSTVTGTMLGNGAANWQGSADYQPVIAEAEDVLTASEVMGLKANPTGESKAAAKAAAKVYINGNYSYTHGGGIMCNGNLIVGLPEDIEVPARVDLQATKKLIDQDGDAHSLEENDFSFKVTMTEPDGTVIAEGICDSNGTIVFDHQLTFKEEGTFIYYIYEEADEDNISVSYDSILYRLTVTVERDNGVAWYGDTVKYTYLITSVKIESSMDGETWTQISRNNESQSGVISLPLTSGATFTNRIIEPTKVTVQKKWVGGVGADSVTVILKKDGEEYDRQILNDENEWTYTWNDLETGYSYTIEEVAIPGYTVDYEITTSQESDGQNSLGEGSWWVPASELTAGNQYLIVSGDGTKALCVASGNEAQGFDSSDVTDLTPRTASLTVGGQTYSSWYQESEIPARSIYDAESLPRSSHSGIILKRSDGVSYPYLRLESNNNNYLKGGSTTQYASFMMFDGVYLKGHNASEWTPDNLRTVVYADGKFNTVTAVNPANAAKLYTLVSGEGFTGSVTDRTTVIITNTPEETGGDYILPKTGGFGTVWYTIGGILLVVSAGCLLLYRSIKHKRGNTRFF